MGARQAVSVPRSWTPARDLAGWGMDAGPPQLACSCGAGAWLQDHHSFYAFLWCWGMAAGPPQLLCLPVGLALAQRRRVGALPAAHPGRLAAGQLRRLWCCRLPCPPVAAGRLWCCRLPCPPVAAGRLWCCRLPCPPVAAGRPGRVQAHACAASKAQALVRAPATRTPAHDCGGCCWLQGVCGILFGWAVDVAAQAWEWVRGPRAPALGSDAGHVSSTAQHGQPLGHAADWGGCMMQQAQHGQPLGHAADREARLLACCFLGAVSGCVTTHSACPAGAGGGRGHRQGRCHAGPLCQRRAQHCRSEGNACPAVAGAAGRAVCRRHVTTDEGGRGPAFGPGQWSHSGSPALRSSQLRAQRTVRAGLHSCYMRSERLDEQAASAHAAGAPCWGRADGRRSCDVEPGGGGARP